MNYKPRSDIMDSVKQVRADILAYQKQIEERGFVPTSEPTSGGASIFKPVPGGKTLSVADAWRRELRVLAWHLPKTTKNEAALHFDGQTRYFEHQHLTPKARRQLSPEDQAKIEDSATRMTFNGEIQLIETRLQEAGLDPDLIEASDRTTEGLKARYAALAGMLKAAPDSLPAAKPKPKAAEPAKATATPAKAAPAKARASTPAPMTAAAAAAAYNAIDANDAKARQAFRNQHAALLGIKRG
jgi:hypothetical protein